MANTKREYLTWIYLSDFDVDELIDKLKELKEQYLKPPYKNLYFYTDWEGDCINIEGERDKNQAELDEEKAIQDRYKKQEIERAKALLKAEGEL